MTEEKLIEEMEKLLEAKIALDQISLENEFIHYGKYRSAVDALNELIKDFDESCPPPYYYQ